MLGILSSLLSRDAGFAFLFIIIGLGGGFIIKSEIFPDRCPKTPDCICPECPPQTINYFSITNEKIKTKGGGSIDLSSIIKDNIVLNKIDSIQRKDTTRANKTTPKKRGWFGRLFSKN